MRSHSLHPSPAMPALLARSLRFVPSLLLLALLVVPALPQSAVAQEKKLRVAVLDFEDKTQQSFSFGGRSKHPGEGIADMLTTALFKTGRYDVIERDRLQEILAEQNLGTAGIVTPESAAEIGKALGADALVFGSVTEFGYRERDTGGATRKLGIGVSSTTAEIGIDVRIVDATTAQILAADNVTKTESKRGLKLRTTDLSFGSQSDFDDSLVGQVTREAIEAIVGLLDANAEGVAWGATVITYNNGAVYINAGATSGVEVGDTFVVMRPGEDLIDPDTGLNLGSVEKEVGRIEVTDNQVGNGAASQCRVLAGTDFQRGDIVRE